MSRQKSRQGKISPGSERTDVELRDFGDDDTSSYSSDTHDEMFGRMPSRTANNRSAAGHGRAKSRYGTRRKWADHDNNSDGEMEMIDLEDSSNDPLAQSRNVVKIKSMAVPMAKRKTVKRTHERNTRAKKQKLSCWKAMKLKLGMSWAQFKMRTRDFFHSLQLWRSPLKEVEGEFGNGVLSYFLFLKSLFMLNIIIFVIVFSFLTVPQIAKSYDVFKKANMTTVSSTAAPVAPVNTTTAPVNTSAGALVILSTTPATNSSGNSSFAKLTGSTCTQPSGMIDRGEKSIPDHIVDFITGQGWINTTLLFYSNYDPDTLISTDNIKYDMPLAYILVGGAYFIVSLIIMVHNFSEGFTESVIENGGVFYSYCNKIFASWDYCITSEKAAGLKKKNIYQDFQAELAEEKRRDKVRNRTKFQKCRIYTIRGVVNLIILGGLGGSVYAIILAVQVSEKAVSKKSTGESELLSVVRKWASSLTITGLNLVLPLIFEVLTEFEDFSPRVEVAMKLWSSVLLKLASVGVLVITLYTNVNFHSQCWENQIGAQMFNLILIDFIVIVSITILGETARKYISKYLDCGCHLGAKIGQQEFQIPNNVLDLIYGQSLVWIGTFFAPMIPVIGILKLFFIFYVKKVSLMVNCKPATKPFQGARSNYFFTLLLLLTFLLCVVAVGWAITNVTTSTCGPYGNTACSESARMFGIISKTIKNWPKVLADIIKFLETPAFLVPLIIIVCLILYYFRSMTSAHEHMIEMLKDQLIMEGRDKRFLMERLLTLTRKDGETVKSSTITSSDDYYP